MSFFPAVFDAENSGSVYYRNIAIPRISCRGRLRGKIPCGTNHWSFDQLPTLLAPAYRLGCGSPAWPADHPTCQRYLPVRACPPNFGRTRNPKPPCANSTASNALPPGHLSCCLSNECRCPSPAPRSSSFVLQRSVETGLVKDGSVPPTTLWRTGGSPFAKPSGHDAAPDGKKVKSTVQRRDEPSTRHSLQRLSIYHGKRTPDKAFPAAGEVS